MNTDHLANEAAKLADKLEAMNKRPEPNPRYNRRKTDNHDKDRRS